MPGMVTTETVEIICLANSRKMQGRCLAGLRTDGLGWVRLVAANGDGMLFPAEYRLPDGSEPKLLDVLHVACTRPKPECHQPENVRIARAPWHLAARPAPPLVQALLQTSLVKGPLLLGNFGDKRDFGQINLKPVTASLALIAPDSLLWRIQPSSRGNRQTKADFHLTRTPYSLSVTDPVWTQRLAHLPNGVYPREAAGITASDAVLFTISLSEPTDWNNHCYKLVAGVIVLPQE